MNLLADESVDGPIVARLREEGHHVSYVAEMSPSIADDAVMDHANRRRALLITGDKDFGELVFRLQRVTHGVILVRMAGLPPALKARLVKDAIADHGKEMEHAFTVISPGLVRIRHEI